MKIGLVCQGIHFRIVKNIANTQGRNVGALSWYNAKIEQGQVEGYLRGWLWLWYNGMSVEIVWDNCVRINNRQHFFQTTWAKIAHRNFLGLQMKQNPEIKLTLLLLKKNSVILYFQQRLTQEQTSAQIITVVITLRKKLKVIKKPRQKLFDMRELNEQTEKNTKEHYRKFMKYWGIIEKHMQ